MKRTKTLAGVFVAAVAALAMAGPAGATGDLNCGDPGTHLNMPVGPDDPHGLDSDSPPDGIGCEDPDAFPPPPSTPDTTPDDTTPDTTPDETVPPTVPDTAPPPPAEPEPAAPAAPVVAEPTYTG